jgi:predicted negative regulator of RcsB-dependent stress response
MATTKLDKKDLTEPDKLQLVFLSIRTFVEKHRMRLYAGAGVFILILLLAGGWHFYQLNYEKSAETIYSKVLETAQKAGSPSGDLAAIKGYKDLILKYPRSRAAVTAQYRLGNLYFGRHEIDAAILAYQDFLNRASVDSDLVTLAYNGLGACYESKKDFNKALELIEKAMKTNTASSFEVLNYTSMARVHESMNSNAKAVEFYRKALEKTKDPLMTLYLKRKISNLG